MAEPDVRHPKRRHPRVVYMEMAYREQWRAEIAAKRFRRDPRFLEKR
jgi:hypothetical protein